jgi:signal transduction histidine kinase
MVAERAVSGLSLRARLTLLLSAVGIFLAAALAAQLTLQSRLADERDDLVHRLSRATEATGDLGTAVSDQQSGVRGFILTGDETFLAPYERGRTAAGEALDRLDGLLAGSTAHAERVDRIRTVLATWQREVAEPAITDRQAAGSGEFLDRGEQRFDELRGLIDGLGSSLEAERADDLTDVETAETAISVVVFTLVVGLVILGAVIIRALSRLVLGPLAQLGHDARLVAAGELDHTVRGEGTPDLVGLGADVEGMRARIVAELAELTAIRASLERQAGELARSNADLEQFAYVASHDLQEPLRKVSGFCQLLEKRYAAQLDDRAREYIAFANDGARRMQVLINDLLAFSRVGRSTEAFTPVDLGAAAAEAADLHADAVAASGATVTVGDLPTVDGDRRLLVAVLQNLIGNGLKFRRRDPPEVEVSARSDGDEWTIVVSDNGIGVSPAYADQIFTIFGRLHTRAEYEGTGIGLALSKKIVEYHGGRIWLEPSDHPGATFAFSLPRPPPPDRK